MEESVGRREQILKEEVTLLATIRGSGMPMAYCYPYAMNKFETSVVNQRADTLKECINLMEQERHNQEHLERLRSVEETQEEISNEVSDIKMWTVFDVFTRR